MRKNLLHRAVPVMLAVLWLLMLPGCNMETFHKNEQYVAEVKRLVNGLVDGTRKLKQLDDSFNCHDNEKVQSYLNVTDELIGNLEQIQKLQSTNEFDEMDKNLKTTAKSQLILVSQIRILVCHARESGDDSIYQREKKTYMDDYQKNYEKMRELSSEIQTYWRNA